MKKALIVAALILIVCACVTVFVLGGYSVYRSKQVLKETQAKLDQNKEITPLPSPTDQPQEFEGNLYQGDGYSFYYPDNWKTKDVDSTTGAIFFFPVAGVGDGKEFGENLNILVQKSVGMDLEEYNKISRDQISSGDYLPDSRIVSETEFNFAGYEGTKMIYTATATNGDVITLLAVWTIVDDNAYLLTYAGDSQDYKSYLDDVDFMIESFDIKK